MCRLYAARNIAPSVVVDNVLLADHSLSSQSAYNDDGAGIAALFGDKLIRVRTTHQLSEALSIKSAVRKVAGAPLLVHARESSAGGIAIKNTHPFRDDGWAFAHNGTITDFSAHRSEIESMIHAERRRVLSGETDSE